MKMISKMGFALLALLLGSTGWGQTSFGKYGPVAGVQMNTGATPYNFAAGITDIQTLLSASPGVVLGGATGGAKGVGSINATALFINGAAVGTSSGAVSSVALGSPGTCFGVTGSPVTSAGTLAYTLSGASTGLLRADGSCSNTPVIIAAPSSGTTLTATGVAGGAAGQFTGSGSGDEFFRFNNTAGDTRVTWSSAGTKYGIIQAFTNGFNFAANGASTALDLSVNNGIAVQIQPAGNVAVNVPASGSALTVNGAAGVGVYASRINGSTTASQSFGHLILAGTNAADAALVVNNAANTLTFLDIAGDGSGTLGAKLSWTVGGNVAINAPSSGVAFSATGIANQYAGLFTAGGSAGTQKGLSAVSTTQNAADKILNVNNSVSNLLDIFGDGHGDLGPNLSWTVAGNWSAAAPTSGNTLSIANLVGARGLSVTSPGATNSLSASWAVDFGGAWNLFTQSDSFALGTTGASSLILATASSNRINISGTGNVAISASSSGDTFTSTGSANASAGVFVGSATTGLSFGVGIRGGTNGSDAGLRVFNQAGTRQTLNIAGDGSFYIGNNGTTNAITGSAAGGVTIAAPSSGTNLTLNQISGQNALTITDGTISQSWGNNGTSGYIGTNTAQAFSLVTQGNARVSVSNSGVVTINAPSGGIAETVLAASGSFAAAFGGSSTASNSFGIAVQAGTNSSDANLLLQNAAQSVTFAKVFGDGGVVIGSPTGSDKGVGSINMQSCFVNNVACLTGSSSATHFAAGVITIAAGSCTVNQNTADISSCTFNSTGNVTVNFTTAFTSTTCVVNGVNSSPPFAVATQQGSPTTTASNVLMQSSSGVFVNGIFSIMCLGN